MKEHIHQFEHLLQEHEYHCLINEPLYFAYQNVVFMNSICLTNNPDMDKWQNWFNSIQDTLNDMAFLVLCAKLRAYVEHGNQIFQSASSAQPSNMTFTPSTYNTIPVQTNSLQKRLSGKMIAVTDIVKEIDIMEIIMAMTEIVIVDTESEQVVLEATAVKSVDTIIDSRMAEKTKMPNVITVEKQIIPKKTVGLKMAERMIDIETIEMIAIHGDTTNATNITPTL